MIDKRTGLEIVSPVDAGAFASTGSPNVAVQAAGTNSSTKTPDVQIQPPATVGSDGSGWAAGQRESLCREFNRHFYAIAAMRVDVNGDLEIMACNKAMTFRVNGSIAAVGLAVGPYGYGGPDWPKDAMPPGT